jgi:sterol desaturase/sphingolipid hydroxylase (fatty acid hydroxylase superfamily)
MDSFRNAASTKRVVNSALPGSGCLAMPSSETIELKLGEGRISGAISIFLASLCLLAVLCFHFPEYLTTPELRQAYPVDLLRDLLRAGMVLAIGFGALAIFLGGSKRLGAAGIALTLLAQWLGGANVYVDEFEEPAISFGFDYLVLALLANTVVFVFIERVWPHRSDQLTLRSEWKLDLVYYIFNHLMVSVILLVTTFFSEGLFGWAVNADLQSLIRGQPIWLQFIEVLFAADFTQYWGHRLMHENKWLWNFHAVHHCPARMDWLSGSRMHFAEVLFTRSTVILPIYLLGFAESAINAYVVWVSIQAVLIHANTSIPFGRLEYLFATPHFHHWHHAADEEAIDRNYAAHLPILDLIFGTYVGNHGRWPETYGVVGKPLPRGFLAQHLYPFIAPPKPQRKMPGGNDA